MFILCIIIFILDLLVIFLGYRGKVSDKFVIYFIIITSIVEVLTVIIHDCPKIMCG